MKTIYTSLLSCLMLTVFGQTPTQIQDIFPGAEDSSPTRFFQYGDQLLFRAETPDEGVELWSTDGTSAGTNLILDINTNDDLSSGNSNPDNFIIYNDLVYFKARSDGFGDELWVTDGTSAGTSQLLDIQAGEGNANPFNFIEYNGLLYFTANDGINSSELWVSDGTVAGTQLVVDIRPGNAPGNPNFKTVFNDLLFFTANDGTNGNELWSSDGTAEGTMMVKDIRDGGNASPSQYFEFNGELYFRANNGEVGTELWKTDGTEEGTVLVRDIREGSGSSSPRDFFEFDDQLFFVANDGDGNELWTTAGDSASTVKVFDVNGEDASNPRDFIEVWEDKQLFFVADTDQGANFFLVIASTDGPVFVPQFSIMEDLAGDDPDDIVFTGTSLYFSYENDDVGREIAQYGVAISGEVSVPGEVLAGPGGSSIDDIQLFGDLLIFEADDTTSGRELWSLAASTAYIELRDPEGELVMDSDTIDFGPVTVGFNSLIELTIVNRGTDTSLYLGGVDDLDDPFSASVSFAGENDQLLPSPDDASLTLSFFPVAFDNGEFIDELDVEYLSAVGSRQKIYVRGSTIRPTVEVSESGEQLANNSALDFGDVPTDTDSTRTINLTNVGEGLLVILSASLTGGTEFSVADLQDTLAQGESVALDISFLPTDLGDFSDLLTVVTSDNNNDGNFLVQLNGTAIVNSVYDQSLPTRAVYPNPVDDLLTIELEESLEDGQWRLFAATGQLLQSGRWPQGAASHQLNLSSLPTGHYRLEVNSGNAWVIAKLVKR